MLARRMMQQSTWRLLTQQPLSRYAAPAAISTTKSSLQKRHAAFSPSSAPSPGTTPATPTDAYSILAAQRLNRPISPHISIYQPQVTWYLSGLNRITGSILSGGFYIFGAAYLVSPLFGWHLESAHMAEVFGGLNEYLKGAIKFGIAMPFTFHSWNGIRHLVWDSGREFGTRQVQVTGWTVVGLTVITSGVLAYI